MGASAGVGPRREMRAAGQGGSQSAVLVTSWTALEPLALAEASDGRALRSGS
jgi:hypothetical protein